MSIEYRHPKAHEILMRTKDILSQSTLGDQMLEAYEGTIEVLKGPVAQGFVPTENLIILRVPALQEQAHEEQALDLAGALIEHQTVARNGFPDPMTLQDDETFTYLHYRNLDLIMGVFPVAEELDEEGFKALAALRYAGLSKLYHAWKTGESREECASIYWNMEQ